MNKSLVIILSNMNKAMCHAFIKDQELLLPQVDILDSSEVSKDSRTRSQFTTCMFSVMKKNKMLLKNECGQK